MYYTCTCIDTLWSVCAIYRLLRDAVLSLAPRPREPFSFSDHPLEPERGREREEEDSARAHTKVPFFESLFSAHLLSTER